MPEDIVQPFDSLEPVTRLSRDLRAAAGTLSEGEVRFLVDAFYQIQEDRKRSSNQVLSLETSGEPHSLISWFAGQNERFEDQIKAALGAYSLSHPVGEWVRSICGIGPVIAAGLLAYIDVKDPRTSVAQKWRLAGLDPDVKWLASAETRKLFNEIASTKGPATPAQLAEMAHRLNRNPERVVGRLKDLKRDEQVAELAKRPYSAGLKVLCWKVGQSFVKQKNRPNDFYGAFYDRRKAYETERNANGLYAEQAAKVLKTRNIQEKKARETLESGRLVPAHIDARCRRWTVKLFLSHYVEIAFAHEHSARLREPFAMRLGHSEYIAPPNMPEFFARLL